jgi:LmbE family N-acetylglucosaminyl deacetylase
MLSFDLRAATPDITRVLAIGCHADDVEIGCGGTLLTIARGNRELHVTWVVLTGDGPRSDEASSSASAFLEGVGSSEVRVLGHRECFLPYDGAEIKASFEELKSAEPDLIFTHSRSDLHQDHRLACELTWNTFRDHLILEYEIPKYDGDLGAPNVFVPLDQEVVAEKLALLQEHFPSQSARHWFDDELFRGLMRLRGMESATQYAEAFTCRKLLIHSGRS